MRDGREEQGPSINVCKYYCESLTPARLSCSLMKPPPAYAKPAAVLPGGGFAPACLSAPQIMQMNAYAAAVAALMMVAGNVTANVKGSGRKK